MGSVLSAAVGVAPPVLIAACLSLFAVAPALAQKSGGTARLLHRDSPAGAPIHEEAVISAVAPFSAMFNNLIHFKQDEKPTAKSFTPVEMGAKTLAIDKSRFPDSSNTGVPSGVTLRPSGGLTINTPGAVIEGLDIKGTVIINAPNVTLKNCKITSGGYWVVKINSGVPGAVVQDCEIDNLGAGGQGISGQGTFLRNDIRNTADGINVTGDNTIIEGNYIHDMKGTGDSHFDSIQADGGFSNLTIRHNTIVNEHGQTAALMLDNYWGPIDNVVIDNNLFYGGGYTVYIHETGSGQPGGGTVTNVSFTNNVVGGGRWGDFYIISDLGHRPYLTGNIDYKTGRLLSGQNPLRGGDGNDTRICNTLPGKTCAQ